MDFIKFKCIQARAKLKLPVRCFSKILFKGHTTITSWERGDNIPSKRSMKLIEAINEGGITLDTSLRELIDIL